MNRRAGRRDHAAKVFLKTLWALALCAVAYGMGWPRPAMAQVFELTGGSSSLMDAQGGSLEVHAENYTARLDLGYLGRPSLGFFLSRPYRSSTLGAGDQQIPFVLPTDLFDRSFYFFGRGASFTRNAGGDRLFAFAGATSNGYLRPF